MIEPKKRGRPPGSGKKKETVVIPCKSGNSVVYDTDREDIIAHGETEIQAKANLKVMRTMVEKHESETPFPENWSTMGKIDRLKWLTANR